MSELDQQCQVIKRLDLRVEDLGRLEQLLTEQNLIKSNHFFYTTSLGKELKFVRVRRWLWINEEYNITIRVPI